MEPKLSIIVPIYKVEKYLRRCIDSILAQTMREIEIILIDDGSPDGSGQICDEYAENYEFIHVIHQENAGVSSARNAGIAIAQGEYIGFVDPDDYILPEMMERLCDAITENTADIAGCGFYSIHQKEDRHSICPASLPTGCYDREVLVRQVASHIFGDETVLYPKKTQGYIWLYLYKRSIIAENNITFYSQREYNHEDELFLLDFFCYADKICFIDEPFYCYCVYDNSLNHGYWPNLWEMNSALINKFHEFAQKLDIAEQYEQLIVSTKYDFALAGVLNECKTGCTRPFWQSVKKIKQICCDPMIRELLHSGERREWAWFESLCFFLMRLRTAFLICFLFRAYYHLRKLKGGAG